MIEIRIMDKYAKFDRIAAEKRFFHPASRFVSLQNARVHMIDEGEQSQLPAIIILSSQWLSSFSFDRFVSTLKSETRVIRVDLPGHGLSSRIIDGDYSAHSYARLIDKLTEALALPSYILVGMSFSGIPAAIHAAENPAGLKGLVLVTSSGLARSSTSPSPNQPPPARLSADAAGHYTKEFYAWKLKTLSRRKMDDQTFADLADEVFVMNELDGRADEAKKRVEDYDATIFEQALGQIDLPVLVQWSSDSTYLPPEMAATIKQITPNCVSASVFPKTGHLLLIDVPDETSYDILKFSRSLT